MSRLRACLNILTLIALGVLTNLGLDVESKHQHLHQRQHGLLSQTTHLAP